MRGTDETMGSLFSYVDLDERIPTRHPLRKVREIVNDALASMDAEFDGSVHGGGGDFGVAGGGHREMRLRWSCRTSR